MRVSVVRTSSPSSSLGGVYFLRVKEFPPDRHLPLFADCQNFEVLMGQGLLQPSKDDQILSFARHFQCDYAEAMLPPASRDNNCF